MKIRQPFVKQPIPRFGGGSTPVFIFEMLCGSWPAQQSLFHESAQSFRQQLRPAQDQHKVGLTMIMQPRSAQPQISVIHRFDSNAVKMRIALSSSEEMDLTGYG